VTLAYVCPESGHVHVGVLVFVSDLLCGGRTIGHLAADPKLVAHVNLPSRGLSEIGQNLLHHLHDATSAIS